MKKMLFCALLILFFLIVFVGYSNTKIYADQFYSSGGDISACNLSIALAVGYAALPVPYSFTQGGGISYNQAQVSGINLSGHTFSDFATDLYPSASRFPNIGTSLKVPPGTQVSVAGYFKNDNLYNVGVPAGGILFTSLSDASSGDLTNIIAGASLPIHTSSVIYNGKIYMRRGEGISVPRIGIVPANSAISSPLYSFTTITPLKVTRTVSTSYTKSGELLINIILLITNTSRYNLQDITISDALPGVYQFKKVINLPADQSETDTYGGNAGIAYGSTLLVPPAFVTDPNTHTEVFATGEGTYEENPDATVAVFPRDDLHAPVGWTGNQSALPLLSPSAQMSVTLLPYSVYSSYTLLHLAPFLTVTKMQNGTENKVEGIPGSPIFYTLTMRNSGNAPAANIYVTDSIPQDMNVTDPGSGMACSYQAGITYAGFGCFKQVIWYIPYIDSGSSIQISFTETIANTAYAGEDISDFAVVSYNKEYNSFSNRVDVLAGAVPPVFPIADTPVAISLASESTSGSILGIVWNDRNMNAAYDPGESFLSGIPVQISYRDSFGTHITKHVFTTKTGAYETDDLPLNTPIEVIIERPEFYQYQSTYSRYRIVLVNAPVVTTYHSFGSLLTVKASRYFAAASMGVFNEELADTGQNITGIWLAAVIAVLFLLVTLFKCRSFFDIIKQLSKKHV